jgi:putative SOS response-associated peptidase YedK
MPVILHQSDYHVWLDPGTPLELATSLLVPFPDAEMRAYAVSRLVNSPANDTPDVISPIAA